MERDEKGQFLPGQGGPGRLPRQTEHEYMKALKKSLSIEDFEKIVRKAVEQAIDGDQKAREWLSNYALGKPAEKIKLTADIPQQIVLTWGGIAQPTLNNPELSECDDQALLTDGDHGDD